MVGTLRIFERIGLLSFHTQQVHTQEEGNAPGVEACAPSAGMLVAGPAVGPGGPPVADASVFSSTAEPELPIVGRKFEVGSAVSDAALGDSWDT